MVSHNILTMYKGMNNWMNFSIDTPWYVPNHHGEKDVVGDGWMMMNALPFCSRLVKQTCFLDRFRMTFQKMYIASSGEFAYSITFTTEIYPRPNDAFKLDKWFCWTGNFCQFDIRWQAINWNRKSSRLMPSWCSSQATNNTAFFFVAHSLDLTIGLLLKLTRLLWMFRSRQPLPLPSFRYRQSFSRAIAIHYPLVAHLIGII